MRAIVLQNPTKIIKFIVCLRILQHTVKRILEYIDLCEHD